MPAKDMTGAIDAYDKLHDIAEAHGRLVAGALTSATLLDDGAVHAAGHPGARRRARRSAARPARRGPPACGAARP
jgi:hypothetical protein